MSSAKGTYLLFLLIQQEITIPIGALGLKTFEPGSYIYVGSAMGSGGLAKRIDRHLKQEKKLFWHIDYLLHLDFVETKAYGKIYSNKKIECDLVQQITNLHDDSSVIVLNFGSSDCNCKSHLLFFKEQSIKYLVNRLEDKIKKKQLEITYL